MMTFCTLFDSTYMSRGMAMYRSLCRQCNNFHLYIFAFDDYCYNFFSSNDFEHVTVISLQEFEDQRLLVAKKESILVVNIVGHVRLQLYFMF